MFDNACIDGGGPGDDAVDELRLRSERQSWSGSTPSCSESWPIVGSKLCWFLVVMGSTRLFDSFHASWKREIIACVSFSSCAEHRAGFACVAAKMFLTSVVITPDAVHKRECVLSSGVSVVAMFIQN